MMPMGWRPCHIEGGEKWRPVSGRGGAWVGRPRHNGVSGDGDPFRVEAVPGPGDPDTTDVLGLNLFFRRDWV